MSREGVIRGAAVHTTQSSSSTWAGAFDALQFQKGTGVVVEGTVVEVRNHSLTANGTLHKFLAILVDTTSIRKRTFNLEGKEIETNPGGERLVAKGYLTWDHKKDADAKKISADEFRRILDITAASKLIPASSNMHPNRVGRFEFWGPFAEFMQHDVKPGSIIRLKTKGDSIFMESFAKDNDTKQNYAGENVAGGWESKLAAAKSTAVAAKEKKELPQNKLQGVAEDEWDA